MRNFVLHSQNCVSKVGYLLGGTVYFVKLVRREFRGISRDDKAEERQDHQRAKGDVWIVTSAIAYHQNSNEKYNENKEKLLHRVKYGSEHIREHILHCQSVYDLFETADLPLRKRLPHQTASRTSWTKRTTVL